MQSHFLAMFELIKIVRDGLILTNSNANFDETVDAHIKAIKRHRQESEYAETEMISTGLTIRHIKQNFFSGAIVFQTRHDGKFHPSSELVEQDGTYYFPARIIEKF